MSKRLLKRQLRRHKLSQEKLPTDAKAWEQFLIAVEEAYSQFDEDRIQLEKTLERTSEEMKDEIQTNKEMSLQLAQAGKLASVGTLASGVAHELNNPLAAIKGFVEIMLLKSKPSPEQKDMLSKIERLTDRMATTIRHLLKLSRQTKESDYTKVDIREPIDDTLELLSKQFEMDEIAIKVNHLSTASHILGSANNICGIILNFCTNSRDAFLDAETVENRSIEISIKDGADNSVEVLFSDNAGGIPDEILSRVFDPFFTTKDVGVGTGLGLALNKQLIEEMGGELSVKSEKGVGSTFTITLPGYKETTTKKIRSIGGTKNTQHWATIPTDRKRLLLVDDEEDLCSVLSDVLEEHFEVTSTTSSEKALELLTNDSFDMLITDLKMPVISGEKVATHAKKYNPNCSVVIISGHVHSELPDTLRNKEQFLFLEKPLPQRSILIQKLLTHLTSDQKKAAA